MAYTLGTASLPNTTWGTYYNNFGTVQRESQRKVSSLTPMGMFGFDSDDTDVFDFGGTVRKISVTIAKIDTSTNLATFVTALNSLINGDQSPDEGYPIAYVSDLLGTIQVKIDSIDFEWNAGRPTLLVYTLSLIESSTLG